MPLNRTPLRVGAYQQPEAHLVKVLNEENQEPEFENSLINRS